MAQSYLPLYVFPKEHCTESASTADDDQMTVSASNLNEWPSSRKQLKEEEKAHQARIKGYPVTI
jgi:hypothetical protein